MLKMIYKYFLWTPPPKELNPLFLLTCLSIFLPLFPVAGFPGLPKPSIPHNKELYYGENQIGRKKTGNRGFNFVCPHFKPGVIALGWKVLLHKSVPLTLPKYWSSELGSTNSVVGPRIYSHPYQHRLYLHSVTRVMEPLCCNPDPSRTVTDRGSPLGNIMRKRRENCISMNSATVSFRQKI